MRPTARGVAAALSALTILTVARWLNYPLLFAIGAGAGIAVLLAVVLVATAPRWSLTRTVEPPQVRRNQTAYARVEITNRGRRSLPPVTARDRVGGVGDVEMALSAVPGRGTGRRLFELPTARRGVFDIGPLIIEYGDPLGLMVRRQIVADTAQLWVLPRIHAVRGMPGGRGARHGSATADTIFRGSTEFRSLREYVIGDDIKNLHWKSTARAGQLMVREFTDPWRPRVTILLDNRAASLPSDAFEEAVDVAASLHDGAVRAEATAVVQVTAGSQDVGAGKAFAGRAAEPDAVEQLLCRVERSDTAVPLTDLATSSCLVFITGGPATADIDLLAVLKRRADTVIVVDLQPAGRLTAGVPVITAHTATDAVAQWNAMVTR